MKIHSKFNDYYDSAMAYGVDDHLHWIREVEEFELAKSSSIFYSKGKNSEEKYPFFTNDIYTDCPRKNRGYIGDYNGNWSVKFLGVCGKIYPVYEYSYYHPMGGQRTEHAYTVEGIVKIMEDHNSSFLPTFMSKPEKSTKWVNNKDHFRYELVKKYLEKHSGSNKFDQYFIEHNTPVFVIDPNVTNPREREKAMLYIHASLKKYHFAKVMDPFTVYQEIEMYMGGILGLIEPDITNIDDNYLAESKGFDKWSFKTMPTKHKNKG